MTDAVASALAETAEYLKLDGQRGLAATYSKAAESIRRQDFLPANPAEVDGVGPSLRDDVAEFQHTGSIELLEELKERYPYYEEMRNIEGVGPITARRLDEEGISSTEELEAAIESGAVLDVEGIGPATAKKLKRNL